MNPRKKINPLFFALLIPAVIIGGAAFLLFTRGNKTGNAQPLPTDALLTAPATLRGNTYSLQCIIERQLAQGESGRILAVKYFEQTGRVSVFVPASIEQNFEVGQRYTMLVRVVDDMLRVEELTKF